MTIHVMDREYLVLIRFGLQQVMFGHATSTHPAAAAAAISRKMSVEDHETITEIRVIDVEDMKEIST